MARWRLGAVYGMIERTNGKTVDVARPLIRPIARSCVFCVAHSQSWPLRARAAHLRSAARARRGHDWE